MFYRRRCDNTDIKRFLIRKEKCKAWFRSSVKEINVYVFCTQRKTKLALQRLYSLSLAKPFISMFTNSWLMMFYLVFNSTCCRCLFEYSWERQLLLLGAVSSIMYTDKVTHSITPQIRTLRIKMLYLILARIWFFKSSVVEWITCRASLNRSNDERKDNNWCFTGYLDPYRFEFYLWQIWTGFLFKTWMR